MRTTVSIPHLRFRLAMLLLASLVALLTGTLGAGPADDAHAAVSRQLPQPPSDAWTGLLELALARVHAQATFAAEQGAIIEPTPDGKAFTVFWSPVVDEQILTRPTIVTLHGSDGFAFNDLAIWHRYAAARGYAILALQWWLGTGDGPDGYLRPREAHAGILAALRARSAAPGSVLLHGFSRGSANIYGVAALDRTEGGQFVRFVMANAGGATPDFPINRDLIAGLLGATPLAGTAWATYCGDRDPNPERDGCPAMRRTAAWVTGLGGEIDLQIEDPTRGHGGFHQTPAHIEAVLDRFAGRRAAGN